MPPKANKAWTMRRGYAAAARKTSSPARKPVAVQKSGRTTTKK